MIKRKLLFLADENLEYRIITHLRKKGYDVFAITEGLASMKDENVIENAYHENRIILTNDKDFGDLIFLQKLRHKGVILFRFKNENILDKIDAIDILLKNHKDKLQNKFVLVEDTRVKIRS